jgi:hypothetical protein
MKRKQRRKSDFQRKKSDFPYIMSLDTPLIWSYAHRFVNRMNHDEFMFGNMKIRFLKKEDMDRCVAYTEFPFDDMIHE